MRSDILDIGKKIRSLRQQNGLSQVSLADIIGVSKSTMSNYERNFSTPDPEVLLKLADYFNVSIDFLFSHQDFGFKGELTKESVTYANNAFNKDESNALSYYNRLSDENKDYIKGLMIQLYRRENNIQSDFPKLKIKEGKTSP
jgi:transcriptional regulator with XRE-family HTH domain